MQTTTPKPHRQAMLPLAVCMTAALALGACRATQTASTTSATTEAATTQAATTDTTTTASEVLTLNSHGAASDANYDYYYSSEQGGVVRVARDGSGTEVVLAVEDSDTDIPLLSCFTVTGDKLFFLMSRTTYELDAEGNFTTGEGGTHLFSQTAEVHAIDLSSGEDAVLKTISSNSGESVDAGIETIGVRDGSLYVLSFERGDGLVESAGDGGTQAQNTYTLVSMDEDGANEQEILSYTASATSIGHVIGDGEVHYVDGTISDAGAALNKLYRVSSDNPSPELVYTGSLNYLGDAFLTSERLFFYETDYMGTVRIVSCATDGTDPQTLVEVSGATNAELLVQDVRGSMVYATYYYDEGDYSYTVGVLGTAIDGSGNADKTVDGCEVNIVMPDLDYYPVVVNDTIVVKDMGEYDWEGNFTAFG